MPSEAKRNYTPDHKQQSVCPIIVTARQPCCVTWDVSYYHACALGIGNSIFFEIISHAVSI